MPTWSPDWTDVRFDHQAVHAAADACDRAAAVVRDTSWQSQLLAGGARRAGTGAWRLQFDTSLATVAARAEEVEAQLRQAAQQLRAASSAAHAEQAARLESRRQWTLEVAAEQRAGRPLTVR
jgi:hypothetical protein